MMKRIVLGLIFLISAGILFAGDIATVVNLGFSENSRFFMFGLYGINDEIFPYSELYCVNVSANTFVPEGTQKAVYREPIQPGQEGFGALLTLLKESAPLVDKYGINHLKKGRILYLLLDGDEPKEHLEFRDFNTGNRYNVTLIQSVQGEGDSISASFFIDVTVEFSGGGTKHVTVGRPKYRRPGVIRYQIDRILLSPDERSLVLIVEKEERDPVGINVRYMVETVRIK